ncbi:hypothetical protein [Nocardioides sp. 503]|uniref:hypothetical protein n=1 Tax=Nocardioides sp. 503 TaxID=2508326 RepID=UPI00107023C3|nr:hypothetical protein [Nocardioides sp. 503]
MTDPFEQARETLAPADREPDWAALRRDTLQRVAADRAQEGETGHHHSPRWTALVAAAAVAAVVVGVLGVSQLTDRQEAPPAPAATTPLEELPADGVLDEVHRTAVDGPEPLTATVRVVSGFDERTTIAVSRDSLVLTTGRYTYAEQGAPGEPRRATFVDHARRVWLSSDDGRVAPKVLSRLPARLRALVATDLLGPLFDPTGWQVASSSPGRAQPDGNLTLELVPDVTPAPTRDPGSAIGAGDPSATHTYVVDPQRRLAVRVRVDLGATTVGSVLGGRITWSPASEVRLYDLVPSGYEDLNAGPG